jgi:two-component system sensor histidine kinase RegB
MTVEREGIVGFIQAASRHNLRQLMLVRNIAIAGQVVVVLVVAGCLRVPLPIAELASVTGFLVVFNLAALWRLKRPWAVTELEVLGQILVDVAAITALLYFSGGTTNPFAGLYLVPVTIAAASLRWSYALPVVALTLACYSLLVFVHVPMPIALVPHYDQQIRTLGTWVNYLVNACLIAYFVVTVANLLREQTRTLAEEAQRDINREYLARVGALAAGAAHEIRSPLSTMAVLVKELLHQHDNRMQLTESLRIMSDQIEACRRTLTDLVTYRNQDATNGAPGRPVDAFLDEVVKRWRVFRPGVKLVCRWTRSGPLPEIRAERSLEHAIVNLLNNAADASPDTVEFVCRWSPGALKILIQDRGPGFPAELGNALGEVYLTTKRGKGTGIGLLLAKTAIRRAGGTLMLSNRSGGGARAEVILPLPQERAGSALPLERLRALAVRASMKEPERLANEYRTLSERR